MYKLSSVHSGSFGCKNKKKFKENNMSRVDLVIFGATGFTGKKAVEETVMFAKKYPGLTWAVAGRSQGKLNSLMAEVAKKTGEDLQNISILIADTNDMDSLKQMCSRAKVVVNCCGPYRLYGEPVVRAAVESRVHYVDVSGEPQFMETMQLRYNEQAREAGVYVVSACGFDSVPNDMGVVYLEQNFNGTLNSVESYIRVYIADEYKAEAAEYGTVNYGTWQSLVLGASHRNELGPLRRQLFPQKLPTFKPKLTQRSVIHKRDGKYCLPFPGADNSVVYRTQRFVYEHEEKRPVQFRAYLVFDSLMSTLLTMFGLLMLLVMTTTKFTQKLLLDYPWLCSFGNVTRDGPPENVMNNTFFEMMLHGEGWDRGEDVNSVPPKKKMVAKVTGVNIGYGATVTALVLSAITVLKQQDKMPSAGGVMTTGAAFRNTDLIKNLHENNFKFEIVAAEN